MAAALVAYATRTGGTAEIAGALADELGECGVSATVLPGSPLRGTAPSQTVAPGGGS